MDDEGTINEEDDEDGGTSVEKNSRESSYVAKDTDPNESEINQEEILALKKKLDFEAIKKTVPPSGEASADTRKQGNDTQLFSQMLNEFS